MKPLMAKLLLVLPALFFFNWILMAVFGCISLMCGAGSNFYCSIYCYFGIALCSLTLIFVLYLVFKQHIPRKIDS